MKSPQRKAERAQKARNLRKKFEKARDIKNNNWPDHIAKGMHLVAGHGVIPPSKKYKAKKVIKN